MISTAAIERIRTSDVSASRRLREDHARNRRHLHVEPIGPAGRDARVDRADAGAGRHAVGAAGRRQPFDRRHAGRARGFAGPAAAAHRRRAASGLLACAQPRNGRGHGRSARLDRRRRAGRSGVVRGLPGGGCPASGGRVLRRSHRSALRRSAACVVRGQPRRVRRRARARVNLGPGLDCQLSPSDRRLRRKLWKARLRLWTSLGRRDERWARALKSGATAKGMLDERRTLRDR